MIAAGAEFSIARYDNANNIEPSNAVLLSDADEMTLLQEVHSRNFTITDSSDTDKAEIVYNEISETIDFNFL